MKYYKEEIQLLINNNNTGVFIIEEDDSEKEDLFVCEEGISCDRKYMNPMNHNKKRICGKCNKIEKVNE